jgi:hypothetical protein
MRPEALDVLLACLGRLCEANRYWCRVAKIHHEHLLISRLADAEACLPELETILQAIAEEEYLRIEKTVELADILEISSDPPPRLDDLVAALPEELGRELSNAGAALRAALVGARALADRIRGVAEIGLRISESVLSMTRRAATASTRPPAAYVRGGRRTVGTAVPVFQRAWRA